VGGRQESKVLTRKSTWGGGWEEESVVRLPLKRSVYWPSPGQKPSLLPWDTKGLKGHRRREETNHQRVTNGHILESGQSERGKKLGRKTNFEQTKRCDHAESRKTSTEIKQKSGKKEQQFLSWFLRSQQVWRKRWEKIHWYKKGIIEHPD